MIQSADGMAVTMQGALEADIIGTDRRPTVWMVDIRPQDELQILSGAYTGLVKQILIH